MTWSKFGTEFFDQMVDADFHPSLDDAAQLTHTQAIHYLYSVEGNTLVFKKSTLRRFATSQQAPAAADELVRCGLWEDLGNSYRVVHHADVVRQSLAAQSTKRDKDKAYQRKRRAQGADKSTGAAEESQAPAEHTAPQQEQQPEPEPVSSWAVAEIPSEPVDKSTGELFPSREAQYDAFNGRGPDGKVTPIFQREAI